MEKKRETRKERDIKDREKTGGEEGRRKSMDNMEGNKERKKNVITGCE